MSDNPNLFQTLHPLADRAARVTMEEMFVILSNEFKGKICFSTSFSKEDQVITDIIASLNLGIEIFTLDTGRLFQETYSVWRASLERYKLNIQTFTPNHVLLESFQNLKGPNSFYESVENRKECCHIRKVEPLKRALTGMEVWITGLRSAHSADRNNMPQLEWDENNRIIKYHPLIEWSQEKIDQRIAERNIPYNPLHDRGFVSIGCLPCTRAIKPGEDFRAGRWWWEDSSKKECGLHVHENSHENAQMHEHEKVHENSPSPINHLNQ